MKLPSHEITNLVSLSIICVQRKRAKEEKMAVAGAKNVESRLSLVPKPQNKQFGPTDPIDIGRRKSAFWIKYLGLTLLKNLFLSRNIIYILYSTDNDAMTDAFEREALTESAGRSILWFLYFYLICHFVFPVVNKPKPNLNLNFTIVCVSDNLSNLYTVRPFNLDWFVGENSRKTNPNYTDTL